MGIFKKLGDLFKSASQPGAPFQEIRVRCRRCGEVLSTRINLHNDLSSEYGDGGTTYHCRKVLIGDGPCFQRVEVKLTYDGNRKLLERQISGGEFVDEQAG